MAIFNASNSNQAFTSASLNLGALVDADILVATPTLIQFFFPSTGTGNNFRGFGFTFDAGSGTVTGGTVTSIEFFSGGVVQYALSGISISAVQVQNFVFSGDNSGFLAAVLGGNDVIIGSAFADFGGLSALGGNDTIAGGPGGDNINGGTGTDTASYAGAAARVDVRLINGTGFAGEAIGDALTSIENLVGSAFNDVLGGDNGVNALAGGNGNDILNAFGANDTLNGQAGNDTLIGGAGADTLIGGTGNDTASYQNATGRVTVRLDLGSGFLSDAAGDSYSSIESATGSNFNDTLVGTSGANALRGGAGNDLLLGGAGADAQNGGTGTDTVTYQNAPGRVAVRLDLGLGFLSDAAGDSYAAVENVTGSPFNDTLVGNAAANALNGGAGNDLLIGGAAADALNGGGGIDTASFQNAGSAVTARLNTGNGIVGDAAGDTYTAIENLIGSNFNDTLLGNGFANRLTGGAGNDTLLGGGGNDFLTGGTGADALNGGTGTDTVGFAGAFAGVRAQLNTGTGVAGEAAGDSYVAIENLTGSNFNDTLFGSFADNTLTGGAGNDVLAGGGGDDLLIGGSGGDALNGGPGTDTVSYAGAGTAVNARLNTGAGIAGDAAGDSYVGVENLTGGNSNDVLLGNGAANTLAGGAGNDTLLGGGGNDLLVGGTGADTMNGGTGSDTASYANATARVDARLNISKGIAGEATGDVYMAIENLTGSAFNDTLFGNSVANTLTGGTGNDLLAGGGGNDLFVFDTGDGNDTIIGFAGGAGAGDVIFYNNGADLPDNFAQVQAAAVQNGMNTVITFGSDSITLLNFNVANLAADDFMFG